MQITDAVIVRDADDLVEQIQLRDIKVQKTQRELIAQWIKQGIDMLYLYNEYNYTRDNIVEVTQISAGAVSMYLTLASDNRLVEMVTSDGMNSNSKQIERFNQKDLKKLTTLDDIAFNKTIESGKFPKCVKENKSIKLTVKEQILNKQEHIQQLKDEIKTLQIQSGLDVDDRFEVPQLNVKLKPQFKQKPINQVDLKSGNIVASFESLGDASKQTGYSKSSLSKCCNDKQKQAHGFKWKYVDTITDA